MSDDHDRFASWVYAIAFLLVLLALIFGGLHSCVRDAQTACRQRGGRIIHVHTSRDPWAWACIGDRP